MSKRISELDNLTSGNVQDTDEIEVGRPATANYKFTWTNVKAALKAYFDTIYVNISHLTDFNNHKARHQDGGADEISIAGLEGESAELNTHKAVQTSVHGSTSDATASKIVHRDANGRAKVADGSDSADIATKGQMDTALLLKANDSAVLKKDGSVSPTADISMGGYKLTNLAAPISDSDAARKIDVDNAGGMQILEVSQQDTPDLTLQVSAGNVWFGSSLVEYAGGNSPSFTAPASNPRIDVLSLNSAGTLVRTAGSESASPAMPAVPAGNIPIYSVYNRVGQTSVKDADDSTNGYIYKDLRRVINKLDVHYPGTEILGASDAEKAIDASETTYTKKKEILIGKAGRVTVSFELKRDGGVSYGKIYINDIAVGTERMDNTSSYVKFDEDFDVSIGDLIQIYGKCPSGGGGKIQRFRILVGNSYNAITTLD